MMPPIETIMIWAAGYRPANLAEDHPEDREQVAKMGVTVLFAAAVATLNWAVAGWTYADGGDGVRLLFAVLAALFGATIVLVFDRSFVYFFDTLPDVRGFRYAVFAVFRIGVVVAIGSITSQAVMPRLIGNDLKVTALHMLENGEQQRDLKLRTQFRIGSKENAVASAIEQVNTLEKAASTVPQDIKQQLSDAEHCWANYYSRKNALIRSGYRKGEARAALSQKFADCSGKAQSAETRRDAYLSAMREQLAMERAKKQQLEDDLLATTNAVKTKSADALAIEKQSLDPRSSIVMWTLLKNNPGALFKWAVFSAVLLFCELLPLLQKFVSGRSAIGCRYANDCNLRKAEQSGRAQLREHDLKMTAAVSRLSESAIQDALANPELQAVFAKKFADYLTAIAPIESVRALMQSLKERNLDKREFIAAHPQYAELIAEAWSNALKDTIAMLNRGVLGGSMYAGK